VESAKENLDWVKKYGSDIELWLQSGASSSTTQAATLGVSSSVLYTTLFFSTLHQIVTAFK
jgi:hypothetical protein